MKDLLSLQVGPWLGYVILAFLLVSGLSPHEARAQSRWLQNVELITPMQQGSTAETLLDTLFYVIQDEPVALKRSPEDATTVDFETLENTLLDEGLDFTSANHLFIGYRLEANQRRFNSEITHLYFIYRSEEADAIDIPIFYLDATQPAIQSTLVNSGTPLALNEAAFLPFSEQLTFHKVPESTIVSVGGRVIRDPAEAAAEKKRLLDIIRRFLF
jgi:hypothetical protein